MLLSEEEWMDLRVYSALRAAGASWADIAREAGCDWRTAKKYLSKGSPPTPPKVTGRPRSATCPSPGPRPTWSSSWSPGVTSAGRSS